MRIGFNPPQFGSHAHYPEGVAVFARQAEEMGADSLWVGDRLLAPLGNAPSLLRPLGQDWLCRNIRCCA